MLFEATTPNAAMYEVVRDRRDARPMDWSGAGIKLCRAEVEPSRMLLLLLTVDSGRLSKGLRLLPAWYHTPQLSISYVREMLHIDDK
jgi:hypothetical protein